MDPQPDGVIIDFRQPKDFSLSHLPGSINIPLESLRRIDPSPFNDSKLLSQQWRELEKLFTRVDPDTNTPAAEQLKGRHVFTICYNGDTSRIANSVLRAKGVRSDSCRGGVEGLSRWLESVVKVPDSPPLDLKVEAALEITEIRADGL